MTEFETRDFTAVFSIQVPKGTSDEEVAAQIAYMQDHFDNQWGQTHNTEDAWTVTIHGDDPIAYSETLGPCGCVDYHMADCPLITDRGGTIDPPEPDDDYDPDRFRD